MLRRELPAALHINHMRRETAELIPRHHIVRRRRHDLLRAVTEQGFARHVTKAHALAVAEETRSDWQSRANRRQRFVTPRGGNAIRRGEQLVLQRRVAAAPLGNFQTGAELVIRVVNRVREQPRQKCRAAPALHKLRRAREQPQHQAHQRWIRNVPRRDVNEKLRPGRNGGPRKLIFAGRGDQFIQPLRIPKFLPEQGPQIFPRELAEELIQPALQRGPAKPRFARPLSEREFTERVVGLQPALRQIRNELHDLIRRPWHEVLFAIALQRHARLGEQRRRERCPGWQIGEKVIGQVHLRVAAAPSSRCSRLRIACRHGNPSSDSKIIPARMP